MEIRPFFKNLTITFITEGLVAVSFFLIYALLGQYYGAQGVGEYSLIKKVFGFLYPIFILGFGVGLPRYIASAIDSNERINYAKSGFAVFFLSCSSLILFSVFFKDFFATIFFAGQEYSSLVFPFAVFFAGMAMHGLVYSYLRGRMMAKFFNALQLINLAVIPIATLSLLNYYSLEIVIIFMGGLIFFSSLFFALPLMKDLMAPSRNLAHSFWTMASYSLPRIPGDFLIAGFFTLPVILAARFISIESAGYFAIGQGIVSAMSLALGPFGVMLLPKVSDLMAQGREKIIKANLGLFGHLLIDASLFCLAQIIIFADLIVYFWLGLEFLPAVVITRIMAIAILGYAFYVSNRSIIDAACFKPMNAINAFYSIISASAVAAVMFFIFRLDLTMILSFIFSLSFIVLGFLTYRTLHKIYHYNIADDCRYFVKSLIINILLAGIALWLKPHIAGNIILFLATIALLSVFYLLILWYTKRDWLRHGIRLVFSGHN